MYIYVSWAYTFAAKEQEIASPDSVKTALPELYAYNNAIQQLEEPPKLDDLTKELLAVRFVIPSIYKVVTYKLSQRLNQDKLSVATAACAFLLNQFPDVWSTDLRLKKPGLITFVGLEGITQFLRYFAFACGVKDTPLPISLYTSTDIVELCSAKDLRQLIAAKAFNTVEEEEKRKYNELLQDWSDIGCSAVRDSALLITASQCLGLGEGENGGTNEV